MKRSPKSPSNNRRNRNLFFLALAVIIALLLLFCNERLNKQDSVQLSDTLSSAPTTPSESRSLVQKIVPGSSVGAVSLGQSAESLRILGRPTRQDSAMGKSWAIWEAHDGSELDVFTTYKDSTMRGKFVRLIRTTSTAFRTTNGTGPGVSLDSLEKALPGLPRVATYTDTKRQMISLWDDVAGGIAYETDDQRCIGVIVHGKGEDVTRYYRTFQPELTLE